MKERYPKRTMGTLAIAMLLLVGSTSLSHTVSAGQTEQVAKQSRHQAEQTTASAKELTQASSQKSTKESMKEATKESAKESKKSTQAKSATEKSSETAQSSKAAGGTTAADWRHPSEDKPYPVLQAEDWIDVSLADQRVKIMRKDQVLYTMICSTGSGGDRGTPTGTYSIQGERGETFFNASSGEGANYWVSWKDHGVYLFHSVPIDASGKYIEKEAEELGQKANSHGCIRLTVADAKWFYEQALYGMKVVVH